jgi:hypothetical protein
MQDINKRMALFKTLVKNLLLDLYGYNMHCQQQELSKFLMHYQQFVPHAYCGATGPVSNMALQQELEKAFCVLRFEVSRSVITVQRESCAHFKKDAPHKNDILFKPCMKLTLHSNHRPEHLKTEHGKLSPAATPSWKLALQQA